MATDHCSLRLRVAVAAALLAGLATLDARHSGQAPPAGQAKPAEVQVPQLPTFRAGVRLVRVDVSVTDRNDDPIDDLRASDFLVEEDDVPQRLETLQFVRLGGQPSGREGESLEIRSPEHALAEASREDVRLFLLFLDDYHIARTPNVIYPLRLALSTFVERLEPSDLIAIVDPLTPLSAVRLTRSTPELLDTIRGFQGRLGQFVPVRSAVEEAQLTMRNVPMVRSQVTLSALASYATWLGGLKEGRKTIVFVSQGPPLGFGMDGNLDDEVRRVTDAANQGNVTIHALDPRGLGGGGYGNRDVLFRLATETGGRAVVNTNSLNAGLRRMADDAKAYYLLGYSPTRTEDDGRFHEITVKVNRPGARVLARRGYWAPAPKTQAQIEAERRPPVPGVAAALTAMAGSRWKGPVDAWVGFSRGQDGMPLVTVTWDPSDDRRGARVAGVDVEVLDAERKRIGEILSLPRAAPGGGDRARATIVLTSAVVALRLTARDTEGAVVDQWERPLSPVDLDAAAIALSSPRVYRARSLVELRALQSGSESAPTASRAFARRDRVFVEVEYYAASATAAPQAVAHLLSADGRELAPLPLRFGENRKGRLELPIGSLGRGTYLLRVRAVLGEATAEQMVAFTVS